MKLLLAVLGWLDDVRATVRMVRDDMRSFGGDAPSTRPDPLNAPTMADLERDL